MAIEPRPVASAVYPDLVLRQLSLTGFVPFAIPLGRERAGVDAWLSSVRAEASPEVPKDIEARTPPCGIKLTEHQETLVIQTNSVKPEHEAKNTKNTKDAKGTKARKVIE